LNCEQRRFAQDPSSFGYVEAGDETSASSGDVLHFEEWDVELSEGIGTVEEASEAGANPGLVWLQDKG
jgi:hypothetical protein